MPYMYAPVAVRPPSPELSLEDRKMAQRYHGIRTLCDSIAHHNNKLWNDKKSPKFCYTKSEQTLIDLIYTLNYKRVYAEHKICMGKHNWRSRIAEVEGHSTLLYPNVSAPTIAHYLNGWVTRPETSDGALSGKESGPSSGIFKHVKLPPFKIQAAAEELRSARYKLEDSIDVWNHERRRAAAMKGHHGKMSYLKLHLPSNDRNRTTPLPRKSWALSGDAKGLTTHVVSSSKLWFELKEDGSVVRGPARHPTPLQALAEKQMGLVDIGFSAYDLVFEKHWQGQLDACAKLEVLRLRHPIPAGTVSPPPSPPVSRKSSPTKSSSPVKSASPIKSKSKSPVKTKKVEVGFEVVKPKMTVSEILSQRAKEQRQRAKQENGSGQGQQQVLELGQQVHLKHSSLDTGSGTGTGRARHQKRQTSPQKVERGRAKWQEDSMKTVRRNISP